MMPNPALPTSHVEQLIRSIVSVYSVSLIRDPKNIPSADQIPSHRSVFIIQAGEHQGKALIFDTSQVNMTEYGSCIESIRQEIIKALGLQDNGTDVVGICLTPPHYGNYERVVGGEPFFSLRSWRAPQKDTPELAMPNTSAFVAWSTVNLTPKLETANGQGNLDAITNQLQERGFTKSLVDPNAWVINVDVGPRKGFLIKVGLYLRHASEQPESGEKLRNWVCDVANSLDGSESLGDVHIRRGIAAAFLEDIFEFNPEKITRGAHSVRNAQE